MPAQYSSIISELRMSVMHPFRWVGASARRITIALGVALLLLLGIATLSARVILYEWAVEDWKEDVGNLSLVLAENTAQTMASAILVLDEITQIVNSGRSDKHSIDDTFPAVATTQMMRDKISGLHQISGAAIIAVDGRIVALTRDIPPQGINVSDRDYFRHHVANNSADIFFSSVVHNRSNNAPTFYLSRRINDANGNMAGIILLGISCDFFTEFFKTISLEKHVSIELTNSGAELLAGWPLASGDILQTSPRTAPPVSHNSVIASIPLLRLLADSIRSAPEIAIRRTVRHTPMAITVSVIEQGFREDWLRAMRLLA